MTLKNKKPLLYVVGKNANTLNLAGMVVKSLNAQNDQDLASDFWTESLKLETIDEVMKLAMNYVEIH